MRLLLDTQMFIWHALKHPSLRAETRRMIDDPANTTFLSHISLFEIAIKQKIGKLPEFHLPTVQIEQLAASRFSLLPITSAHIAAYERIPLLPQHRDPFDRLLLATALAEDMPIISADEHFPLYASLVSVIEG